MKKYNTNDKLIEANKSKDLKKLVKIYAKEAKKNKDKNTACFFATQAYVLSLECNLQSSQELLKFLKKNNRED